ncbi:MAG: GLPGLI family protein [Bacteroidales bacterium]|nr:GLPGLI family protein [Bacteroidales bacterium]
MKRRITLTLLIAMLCFCETFTQAQSISVAGELPPMKMTPKKVYDTAHIWVYYVYSFRKDSTKEKRTEGQTILQIGERFLGFADYYRMKIFHLNDSLCEAKRPSMEFFTLGMGLYRNVAYNMPLVVDLQNKQATVQIDNISNYEYTQPLPTIDWQTIDADTTLCDVPCKKATCRFGGREWTAWYAPTFRLPYGPYLFGGLPGLIFDIRDTKDNYHFSLNGVDNLKVGTEIYLEKKRDIIRTSREKARRAIENEQSDVMKALQMRHPDDKYPTMDGNRSRPYNPLELE